jgi:DNA-binding CsgD family transcriptional regulator
MTTITAGRPAEPECRAGQHPPARTPDRRGHALRADGLTRREAEVLGFLSTGRTNSEIAMILVISVHTVERHLQNAYRRIGVRNRAAAAAYIVGRP